MSIELPNYFLADLPDASTLTSKLITEACEALKQNREKFLLPRKTDQLITVLATLARDWLDPEYPFRKRVLEEGPAKTGFSRETLGNGLNGFFRQITPENLLALVVQDLGSRERLDEFVSDERELREDRASRALGPDLLAHITGGVLPNPILMSTMLGLLARSAQFLKCASGSSYIPRMFAHSLYQAQPKLASCLEIAEWKGGDDRLEAPLFQAAGCLTATGDDETLNAIRRRLPAHVRFLGYGQKLSLAFIARESLAKVGLPKVVAAAARDVAAWDQLGCLSPHAIYVESGGPLPAAAFAELLAKELARLETECPRGRLPTDAAAAITTRRMFYQVRAANNESTKIWSSPDSTAWTVVYEEDPQFQTSCLNRFIFVKAVADPAQLYEAIALLSGQISTVGLSALLDRSQELAGELANRGVSRICQLGRMQSPPLSWRHDGRPALADLVTWSDFEYA